MMTCPPSWGGPDRMSGGGLTNGQALSYTGRDEEGHHFHFQIVVRPSRGHGGGGRAADAAAQPAGPVDPDGLGERAGAFARRTEGQS